MTKEIPKTSDKEQLRREELKLARAYFKKNPKKKRWDTIDSGLGSTYLNTPEGVTRLLNESERDVYAEGGSGFVENSSRLAQKTVVKKQRVYTSIGADKEAAINYDLNIAASRLFLEPHYHEKDHTFDDAYQEFYHLGQPLSKKVTSLVSEAEKVDLAIKVLLKVDALHTGKLSKTGTRYVHLDLKPDNILVAENGDVHLIDFGATSTNLAPLKNSFYSSTGYAAIDKDKVARTKKLSINELITPTPNYLVNDRIATLRTLHNSLVLDGKHFEKESIFNNEDFEKLPKCLQTLIDTSTIAPHLTDERVNESEAFLAAVFIEYQKNPKITIEKINEIRSDPASQTQLIQFYQGLQTPSDSASQTQFIQPKKRDERIQNIRDLNEAKAQEILSKTKKTLNDYTKHLSKQGQLDAILANRKNQLILGILEEINEKKSLTPQESLVKIDTFLCQYYVTLSQKQTRQEQGLFKKLISFFSEYLGLVKGKAIIDEIEKTLDKTLDKTLSDTTKEYRETMTAIRKQTLLNFKANEISEETEQPEEETEQPEEETEQSEIDSSSNTPGVSGNN